MWIYRKGQFYVYLKNHLDVYACGKSVIRLQQTIRSS